MKLTVQIKQDLNTVTNILKNQMVVNFAKQGIAVNPEHIVVLFLTDEDHQFVEVSYTINLEDLQA